jgi:Transglutaminase-like superfamily
MQASTPVRTQLRLAPHVRACHSDGQVILLDLLRNKYLGVGGAHLPALASSVEGWPKYPPWEVAVAEPVDVGALTSPLLKQGLLTTQPVSQPLSPSLQEAVFSLDADDVIAGVALGTRRVCRFLRSAASASLGLRFHSLLSIANGVAARHARLEKPARPVSLEALSDTVGAYQRLRPLVFTAHDRCLHDSLALAHFLASEGIFPRWVIGVRTRPFGAHAWVQSGSIVLNDQHEHVRQFQPILVV